MKLIGLEKVPHLNGQVITLMDYNWERSRWNVRRADGTSVGVLAANLQPLPGDVAGGGPTDASAGSGAGQGGGSESEIPLASKGKVEAWLKSAQEKGNLDKASKYLVAIGKKGGVVKGLRVEEAAVVAAYKMVAGTEDVSKLYADGGAAATESPDVKGNDAAANGLDANEASRRNSGASEAGAAKRRRSG